MVRPWHKTNISWVSHFILVPLLTITVIWVSVTYWSVIGVNTGGSSVKTGSKFWSSLSSTKGGLKGGWHCLFSSWIKWYCYYIYFHINREISRFSKICLKGLWKLTASHSIDLKNGWVCISINLDSLWHPNRSVGFLFKNPFKMPAAFTLKERGIRIVFSKITKMKR